MRTEDLVQFNVIEGESDLQIFTRSNLEIEARREVIKYRLQLEEYIKGHREFLTSLVPIEPKQLAPEIVKHMSTAALKAGVGPMASVAGAISQYTAHSLFQHTDNIIIENGGDIYLKSQDRKSVV